MWLKNCRHSRSVICISVQSRGKWVLVKMVHRNHDRVCSKPDISSLYSTNLRIKSSLQFQPIHRHLVIECPNVTLSAFATHFGYISYHVFLEQTVEICWNAVGEIELDPPFNFIGSGTQTPPTLSSPKTNRCIGQNILALKATKRSSWRILLLKLEASWIFLRSKNNGISNFCIYSIMHHLSGCRATASCSSRS